MNYTEELKRIDERYYDIIVEKYGKYIKDLNKKDRLYVNTNIIPDYDWNRYAKVQGIRGKCDTKSGKIYIRESAFCEQTVIHEYVHRLSRNFIRKGFFSWGYIEGIMQVNKKAAFWGVNEIITEWIAYNITGIFDSTSPYCKGFKAINKWNECPNIFEDIICSYFHNDNKSFIEALESFHNQSTYEVINGLNDAISRLCGYTNE